MPLLSKNKLIVVVGPTAIGKTATAIELAQSYNAEIISCDSRQFFREMKIGTAVPSQEELSSVPHHFIQHLSITDEYSVGDYEREALAFLETYFQHKKIAVLVGGSGLYEKAITMGFDEFPKVNPEIREELNKQYIKEGIDNLQQQLKLADPVYYAEVDLQNHQRVIRALEVFKASGQAFSSFRNRNKTARSFDTIKIGLELPREEMYNRINTRVNQMITDGLVEEAKRLYPQRTLNALQTVGYRELFEYLDGGISLETAIEEIKKNTRRFAKRQMTWFKKDPTISWFSPFQKEEISEFIAMRLMAPN